MNGVSCSRYKSCDVIFMLRYTDISLVCSMDFKVSDCIPSDVCIPMITWHRVPGNADATISNRGNS